MNESYQDMIKRALVLKYVLGRGGRKTKGRWPTKPPSRRSETRQWNLDHPDTPIGLRTRTGQPQWFKEMKKKENSSDS